MNRKILATATILVMAIALVSAAATLITAQPSVTGKVYTMDNAEANNVWQLDRMSDGSVMASDMFPTMGNGTGTQLDSQGALALSEDGNWLCVVNAGSDNITVFQVTDAGLTVADVADSHGMMPISVTVNGNWVYVLNAGSNTTPGNIAGFTVDNAGQLTYIEGSSQPLSGVPNSAPEQIGFNPNATALVVVEKDANMTDVYPVDSMGVAGAPMTMASVGDGPFGFAFTSTGFLIMSEAATSSMSSFDWTDNGSLRTISGAMPDFGKAACWVAISADDTYAYTTNAASGTISTYEISDMGHLNLVSSVAARLDMPTLDLTFSSDSQYLYVLNGQKVTGFQVFPDGGLWEVNSVPDLPMSITGLVAT